MMSPSFLTAAASVLALLPLVAQAGYSASSQENVAIYWGQGSGQKPLGGYCDDPNVNIIPIAFEVSLADPASGLNTGNESPANVGKDIKACQAAGKTILLSIGGATFTENSLTTSDLAKTAARKMWSLFGPLSSSTSTSERPFGDAVIDGFDMDLETPNLSNIGVFVQELRTLIDADSSKSWMLTAAPQCFYPDAADQSFLQGQVHMDAVFVQFYNNPECGVNNFKSASDIGVFNLATWDKWAKTVSKNKNVKIFIGIPGSSAAAGSGYVDSATMSAIIAYAQTFDSFAGIMSWDMVRIVENQGYLGTISKALALGGSGGGNSGSGTTASSVIATTSHAAPVYSSNTGVVSVPTRTATVGYGSVASSKADPTTTSTTVQTSTIATRTTLHTLTRTTRPASTTDTVPGGVFVESSSTAQTSTVVSSSATSAGSNTALPSPTHSATTGSIPSSTSAAATTTATATSSEGQQIPGTACATDGTWICIAGDSFQQCGSGTWSVVMHLAEGTSCTTGTGMSIDIVAIEDSKDQDNSSSSQKEKRVSRHMHRHMRSHS